jgi:DNA-binding LacI/PurR family transcriptional regulator
VGVSQVTLQRSLTALVRQGLIARHRGRGTFVRGDRLQQAGTWFAVVSRPLFDANFSRWELLMARALLNAALHARAGLHFYHDTRLNGDGRAPHYAFDEALRRDVEQHRIRGIVAMTHTFLKRPDLRAQLSRQGIPTLRLSHTGEGDIAVVPDYAAFCRKAVEEAVRRGARTAALIESPILDETGVDLLRDAFGQAAGAAGLETPKPWRATVPNPRPNFGRDATRRLWRGKRRPEAIVVSDDLMAQGVARALVELGVRVPDDVTVITHANVGSDIEYPLPFVRLAFDPDELAGEALRLLMAWSGGKRDRRKFVRVAPHVLA